MRWEAYTIGMRMRFRGLVAREGMLAQGPAGWGEWSPFAEYDAPESLPWLRAAYEAAYQPWPDPVRGSVPVNVTVPAVGPDHAFRLAAQSGCRTAKVKVAEPGQSLAEDLDRVAAVRAGLGPEGRIRVDANGAWTVTDAVSALPRLDRAARGLEYAEQPCRTVPELAKVRRTVAVPVAADESIRRADDPLRVARSQAADIAVLKVQPLGGVRACLDIAERIGLPVVVSSALETSVGIAAGVALAAALPELPYACGLATAGLLVSDVVAEPLLPVDGMLEVRRPEPDPSLLAGCAPDGQRRARWDERRAGVERLRHDLGS